MPTRGKCNEFCKTTVWYFCHLIDFIAILVWKAQNRSQNVSIFKIQPGKPSLYRASFGPDGLPEGSLWFIECLLAPSLIRYTLLWLPSHLNSSYFPPLINELFLIDSSIASQLLNTFGDYLVHLCLNIPFSLTRSSDPWPLRLRGPTPEALRAPKR